MNDGQSQKRILFAGGGTAGHLMPAINIAREMVKSNDVIKPYFVGKKDGMEKRIVESYGFEIGEIDFIGMKRTFAGILKFAMKWYTGYSQAKNIIDTIAPLAVVGTGGYISAPVVRAAHKRKIPVFLQEQNSIPGLATRTSSKYALKIFTAYESASKYLGEGKCSPVGNPVRADLGNGDRETAYGNFNLDSDKKTILVLGGSSGARGINSAVRTLVEEKGIPAEWQLLWQTGADDYENIGSFFSDATSSLTIMPFIDDMPAAYAAADLVISRAGAMAISEITALGLPSILIPYPYATGDHQTINARFVEEAGACVIIREQELNEKLNDTLYELIDDNGKRHVMSENARRLGRPKAAEIMARTILEMIDEI